MILVTGTAGFIGFHLAKKLLEEGHDLIGYDNVNHYYDPSLKEARLKILSDWKTFKFYRKDLVDEQALAAVFDDNSPKILVHLAAQAGVRYSLENPKAYMESNSIGFFNILEACRQHKVEHLIYASSSSVYGMNKKMPFSTQDNVDHPVSLYGATKRSNELMAHAYSHLYAIPTTGLRFFTVYGPWGRPDMALFLFTKAILEGKPIEVYNHGKMKRAFTYINDIISGVLAMLNSPPQAMKQWNDQTPTPSSSNAPFRIYNIGNNTPVNLMDFVQAIENKLEMKAEIRFKPLQPGDVISSHADIGDIIKDFDYRPKTNVEQGVAQFIDWYRSYYKVQP
ncbi:MAG: capsular biosynthesis protein CpsI [Candidatus Marinimicrobia bacterium]|nr:capsular biosynthesis protein CpsI [Candidatus Neomarinimicrobiota bacterium]|tara:strand:+ start:18685 stop:19695 length:1011 start_codon:yes stop_codon:yes gene_type:complete